MGEDLSYGNEEALSGRGSFLAAQVRSELLTRFPLEQIREMTIVDVGCYDGWLLCQLEDLPFAKLVGVEPRQKNIDKGNVIREILGIKTRCEFRQGAIENLDEILEGEAADIVVCTGLFHHLTSPADGVTALRKICRKFLFLETICFPTGIEDTRLRDALELKDLPYFFYDHGFGVTGHKLESGYYDGSATQLSVVSLPSVNALALFLQVGDFENVTVSVDPDTYSRAVPTEGRNFSAVCITASPRMPSRDAERWVLEYEGGLLQALLPFAVIQQLYELHCLNKQVTHNEPLVDIISETISCSESELGPLKVELKERFSDRYILEILKNIRYAPCEKISLEYGKTLISMGNYSEGEHVLFGITRRLNADWRAVYRAFCLISWSARARKDVSASERYASLCQLANPQFPQQLINSDVHYWSG